MPKRQMGLSKLLGVRIPMMPKGVEHFTAELQFGSMCENSDDAERR